MGLAAAAQRSDGPPEVAGGALDEAQQIALSLGARPLLEEIEALRAL